MTRPPRFPLDLGRMHGSTRPSTTQVLRPQRPLHHAAQSAQQQASGRGAPSGLGMDSAAVRRYLKSEFEQFHAALSEVGLAK